MSTGLRVVLAQAAAALFMAAWMAGSPWPLLAGPPAALCVALAIVRIGHRPAHRRFADVLRFAGRRRSLPARAGPADLLTFVRPGAAMSTLDVDDTAVGAVEDTDGLAAVLRLGDPSALLGGALPALPPLHALLPERSRDAPELCLQLLVVGVPAAGTTGASAAAYRRLTGGRGLTRQSVLLAIRARRAGGFGRADLERALGPAVRRAGRVLAKAGVPARTLSPPAVLAALAETAGHDPAHPARAGWAAVRIGGLHHATFHLRHRADKADVVDQLEMPDLTASQGRPAARLLTLPASMVAVSLVTTIADATPPPVPNASASGSGDRSARRGPAPPMVAELLVRLAAATPAALDQAATALHRLVSTASGQPVRPGTGRAIRPGRGPAVRLDGWQAVRLDGMQVEGLAGTLPLGGGTPPDAAALAGLIASRDGPTAALGSPAGPSSGGRRTAGGSAARLVGLVPSLGDAGVVLGVDRNGAAVVVRLFRSEPTRAVLIGGLPCAELLVLRALAVGAGVVVQSSRAHAWDAFLRGLGGGEAVTTAPAGRTVEPTPATLRRPQLLVVDTGPTGARGVTVVESAWRTTLLVRDELTSTDADLLARADLALLQPLTATEAAVAAAALGLGDSAGWLTRIPDDLLAVVANHRTLRWTRLAPTPVELHLTGGVARASTRATAPDGRVGTRP